VRIVFVLRHSGYLRNFESMLRMLAEHGHDIDLAFDIPRPNTAVADRLAEEFQRVQYGYGPARQDAWTTLAYGLRYGIDYLRYLDGFYRGATKLRERGRQSAPPLVLALSRMPLLRTRLGIRLLAWLLRSLDRAIPTCADIDEFLAERDPDLLLVTPLVDGPTQSEWIRSGKKLGIPTALPVTSWDNLTNKGLIRDLPEVVLVWNDIQRREAIELHGVPPDRVVAAGAHTFDHWFSWAPSSSREDFLSRVGLAADRPYLLYLCSSGFIVQDERPVVDRWLQEIRSSGIPELEEVGVLIRPHPAAPRNWRPFEGRPNVSVWPPRAADPRGGETKSEYYDSISHSAAVVGVNTSALIEAAIIGRRSYTVTLPELYEGQEGTIHFHYLVDRNGGPLSVASSFAEHAEQLAAALRDGAPQGWATGFLESFVRPRGLHVAGTPALVAELEALASRPRPAPSRRPFRRRVVATALLPLRNRYALESKEARKAFDRAWGREARLTSASELEAKGLKPPRRPARGPIATLRRSVRRAGYRVVHTVLPMSVRRAVRATLGRPNRFETRLAEEKEARAHKKAERATYKETIHDPWADAAAAPPKPDAAESAPVSPRRDTS
jgi:hypothetical protein